jgi:DNA-binding response OmpR family regulator
MTSAALISPGCGALETEYNRRASTVGSNGRQNVGTKKILLVDDSSTVLLMEKMLLANEGYDLVTASNGRDAIQKTEAERPDLILLDVVMPDINGFEACKQIRARDVNRQIPIIMVTTRSEAANVQIGFESGCNDYVTKPINGVELLTKIKNHLK